MSSNEAFVISPEQAVTLHGLFVERVKRSAQGVAYRYFDGGQNAWISLTWAQVRDQVARWQAALLREELAPGDRVGIMLRNCPQWVMMDQAAMSLGLVVVPLYTVDRADSVAYILNDAGVKVLLFESDEQWQELRSVREQLANVRRLVSLNKISAHNEPRLQWADEWLPAHATLAEQRQHNKDALATIIYTSGTTGRPKGVMLSHYNILFNAHASLDTFAVQPTDLFLSFLPLSHTFERTLGYYLPVMTGSTVAYARSIPLLSEDMQTNQPTLLISVPRIYERIFGAVRSKLDEGSALKRTLFDLAVNVGWHHFEQGQGRATWHPKLLLWPLLKRLVADKILTRLGGRLRVAISGGAALAPEISRVFIGLGLPIVQGYGLTETSPVISGNKLENNFPASVGQPIRGMQVRLGENNALLVKGPCIMQGYWNNPQATAATISADGWLNTGDTAKISASGHITIIGRLKEIIVMSNGEKMPPMDMETAMLREPLFDQVMVHGEARPYLIALAVVNPDNWVRFAQSVGVNPAMPESLHDTRIEQQVLQRITDQTREFPGYARVRRVLLLTKPWNIENGLLTPTLKIKRAAVVKQYSEQIDALYQGH